MGVWTRTESRGKVIVRIIWAPTPALYREWRQRPVWFIKMHSLSGCSIISWPFWGLQSLLWGTVMGLQSEPLLGENLFSCTNHWIGTAFKVLHFCSLISMPRGRLHGGLCGDGLSWSINFKRKMLSCSLTWFVPFPLAWLTLWDSYLLPPHKNLNLLLKAKWPWHFSLSLSLHVDLIGGVFYPFSLPPSHPLPIPTRPPNLMDWIITFYLHSYIFPGRPHFPRNSNIPSIPMTPKSI